VTGSPRANSVLEREATATLQSRYGIVVFAHSPRAQADIRYAPAIAIEVRGDGAPARRG